MNNYVFHFSEIDKYHIASVGGKGANLGELFHVPDIKVPSGFCVSTKAYLDFVNTSQEFTQLLSSLDGIDVESLDALKPVGQRLRSHLEALAIPLSIRQEIVQAWQETGTDHAYAVRSSATAEDLPDASFAGQQDTYLNISGEESILEHIRKCWASLFTERAIAYRTRNGFRHDDVLLSVVVQRMVFPEVSGIMFTADPISGNRKIVSIDASFGLGEALVSGIVSADLYQEKYGVLIKKQIAKKELAIYAEPTGGTTKTQIGDAKQTTPALSDVAALGLARMGRKIEQHFGSPQDIEWCIADSEIFILQSRPITTLYPAPQVLDDSIHLFISIGHPQMMTEAMKPLGISVLRTFAPAGKNSPYSESKYLQAIGGRLFADISPLLEYSALRKRLPGIISNADESIGRAIQEYIDRPEFQAAHDSGKGFDFGLINKTFPTLLSIFRNIVYRDNPQAIEQTNKFIAEKVTEHRRKIFETRGPERIAGIQEILDTLFPAVFQYIGQYMGSAIITYKLIESLSKKWLGDSEEMRGISKSPEGNVTSEMGLALGDLADVVRNHPAVIDYLKQATDQSFFVDLKAVSGGDAAFRAFEKFLDKYGMRATGEIDITRHRWREAPTQLVPAILSHINGISPGQHRRDFEDGKKEAQLAAEKLLSRLNKTPSGFFKAERMQRLIKVHRSLIGLREHPKYFIVQNLDIIKQALLAEGEQLAADGLLTQPHDVFWLSLPELKEALSTGHLDSTVITTRKEQFRYYEKLTPPRAITSEGEIITAKRSANVPQGALAGSAVSAGTITGRARVILKLEEARMDKGDILVAPYTDPGWTPLFPLAAGLVCEVGGLMTHGAVVAREYGIPAVVGVDNATKIIKDGQTIRVDGTQGFVEILE